MPNPFPTFLGTTVFLSNRARIFGGGTWKGERSERGKGKGQEYSEAVPGNYINIFLFTNAILMCPKKLAKLLCAQD